MGLLGGGRDRDRAGEHHIGAFAPEGRAEVAAVLVDRPQHRVLAPYRRDDQRQPGPGRDPRALPGGQDERGHPQSLGGAGMDLRVGGLGPGEVAEQFGDLSGEVLGVPLVPAQRRAYPVGESHGTAEPHVDPAGKERLQHPELLGDDQRLMIGEHHTAGADPDRRGRGGDGRREHGRRGTGDPRHTVMLGDPEPVVAECLDPPCEPHGVAQCRRPVLALPGTGAVEYGERNARCGAHTAFNALPAPGFPGNIG